MDKGQQHHTSARGTLHLRSTMLDWAALALLTTAFIAGCGFTSPVRTPTRPDDDSGPVNPPDGGEPTARACVGLGSPRTADHAAMLNLLNIYRVDNGLNELRYSRTLEQAADQYAVRLFSEDFFDHVAPDGTEPSDRAVAAGFCDRFVGENLAYGLNQVTTAGEAMEGFKNSPGHNENMLRPQWDYVGVGVLEVSGFDGVEHWWVQLFGTEQEAN